MWETAGMAGMVISEQKKIYVPWIRALLERRKHLLGARCPLIQNIPVSYYPVFRLKKKKQNKTEIHED